MSRPRIKNKKKNVTIYLHSEILEKYKNYCIENDIENYSEHISELINKNLDVSEEEMLNFLKYKQ